MNPLVAFLRARAEQSLPGPLNALPGPVKRGIGVVAPLVPGPMGLLGSPGGQLGMSIAPRLMDADQAVARALTGALLLGNARLNPAIRANLASPGGRMAGQSARAYDQGDGNVFARLVAANEAAAHGNELATGVLNAETDPLNLLGPASKLAEAAKLGQLARVLGIADRAQNLPGEALGKVAAPVAGRLLAGLADRQAAREALTKVVGNVPAGELPLVGGKKQLGPIRPPEQFGYARGNVPGAALPTVGGRRQLGPIPPPSAIPVQPAQDLVGAARATARPNPLEQLIGAGRGTAAREVAPIQPRRTIAQIEAAFPKRAEPNPGQAALPQESGVIPADRLRLGLHPDQFDFLDEIRAAVQRGDQKEIGAVRDFATSGMQIPADRVNRTIEEAYQALGAEDRAARLQAIEGSPYFEAFQYFKKNGEIKPVNPTNGKRIPGAAQTRDQIWNLPGSGYDEVADGILARYQFEGHNQNYGQGSDDFWREAQQSFRDYQALKKPGAQAALPEVTSGGIPAARPLGEIGAQLPNAAPEPTGLDFSDRAGTIRAVANAPIEHLNLVLRDLHNAVYPGQQADFAIPALTGQPRTAFRTSFLTDHPSGNAAEPYLDYLISRVQKDPKAAARLAEINPLLADDVGMVTENPLPLTEHKRLVQSLFDVGPQGGGAGRAEQSAQETAPARFTGTVDDVRKLLAGEAGRVGTMYPPSDPAFYAKRANVDPAQVPAMLDQLVQEGTLGRLPDGSLGIKPAAPGLSNVDIPASAALGNYEGPHPGTLAREQFLDTRATDKMIARNYFNETGEKVASSRTTPAITDQIPVGTWRIDDFKGNYGHEIEQLRLLDSGTLQPSEQEIAGNFGGRADDVARYREWLREGKQPPPIHVVERDNGALAVTDGHRRWTAATQEGQPVLAWVSPAAETGKLDAYGKPIKTGLTLELAQKAAPGLDVPPSITDPAERAAWQARYVGQSQAGTDILAAGDKVAGGDLTQADLNALSPQERMAALRKLAAEPAAASPVPPAPATAALKADFDRRAAAFRAAAPDQRGALQGPMKAAAAAYNAAREAEIGTAAFRKEGADQMGTGMANALAPLKKAFGAGEDAAGGGGFGLVPARLGTTLAGAGVGTGVGGLAGGGLGLAAGHRDDQLKEDVAAGAGLGALAGGSVGSVAPEIAPAAAHLATAVGAKFGDTGVDPGLWADAVKVGWQHFQDVRATAGVRGPKEAFDAFWRQWRSQVVNTVKQVPQDALTRKFVQEGIAREEFGLTDGDIRAFQGVLRRERAGGVSGLDNPLTARLRALGASGVLADMQRTYGVDFGTELGQEPVKQFGGLGRALAGAGIGLGSGVKTVNPISPLYGAARGYAAPFVDGMIRFVNGIQHDAFRYALGTKALDRDIPRLSEGFLQDLAGRGVDTAQLTAKGGYFAPEEVAAVAGQQAGKDWATLVEATIRKQGDRIAFLAGDFRKQSETGAERAIGKAVPFARWSIRYAPVLAEIAARHPVATLYVLRELDREKGEAAAQGKQAYQSGITISDRTPLVGLAARARNAGAAGTATINPIGAMVPFTDIASGGSALPDDATGYQRATDLAGRAGFQPNPAIQAAAYVAGQGRAPAALSRTAGLEGLADTAPVLVRALLRGTGNPELADRVPDLALPGGRTILDAARGVVAPAVEQAGLPTTGGGPSDPAERRYAEIVLARTGKPLSDPSNRGLLETMGSADNPLWNLAILQSRAAGAAGNAASLTSPVQTTAQTSAAAAAQAAPKLPYTSYQISQAPKAAQPAMLAANAAAARANPASATYTNISGKSRKDQLIDQWEREHIALKRVNPTYYAQRLKEYKASLK